MSYDDSPSIPTVDLDDVSVLLATEKALLCLIEGKEVWIPRSQIGNNSEVQDVGQSGTLVITAWMAGKKGLI